MRNVLRVLGSALLAIQVGAVAAAEGVARFGDPFPLNTNAASDVEDDFAPQVTTDGLGTWVAVWQSKGSRGCRSGTEVARR